MTPLADDKREMLDESHKFVKSSWKDLKVSFKGMRMSLDLFFKSYALIITQWMTGDD